MHRSSSCTGPQRRVSRSRASGPRSRWNNRFNDGDVCEGSVYLPCPVLKECIYRDLILHMQDFNTSVLIHYFIGFPFYLPLNGVRTHWSLETRIKVMYKQPWSNRNSRFKDFCVLKEYLPCPVLKEYLPCPVLKEYLQCPVLKEYLPRVDIRNQVLLAVSKYW